MMTHTAAAFETVELRRYLMRPGRRDELISLFERQFLETQEACGMCPIGHYRDLDDPDMFVWLRGFETFESRPAALEAFYLRSAAWKAHRYAANETMIDSDNVLLLRPIGPATGFDLHGLTRPSSTEPAIPPPTFLAVSIFMLSAPLGGEVLRQCERAVLEQLRSVAQRIAIFVTDERRNDFPQLPIREDEHAFVVSGVCADAGACEQWRAALIGLPATLHGLVAIEHLRLQPAARSLLR